MVSISWVMSVAKLFIKFDIYTQQLWKYTLIEQSSNTGKIIISFRLTLLNRLFKILSHVLILYACRSECYFITWNTAGMHAYNFDSIYTVQLWFSIRWRSFRCPNFSELVNACILKKYLNWELSCAWSINFLRDFLQMLI